MLHTLTLSLVRTRNLGLAIIMFHIEAILLSVMCTVHNILVIIGDEHPYCQ